MHGKEEDAGIMTYFKDDDAAMCNPACQTCPVICLGCYSNTECEKTISATNKCE